MDTLLSFFLLNVPFFLVFGVPGLLKRKARIVLERKVFIETQRHKAATLRSELFELALDEKISSDSATFRGFYSLLTAIVRNPDRFDELAEVACNVVSTAKQTSGGDFVNTVRTEKPSWPKEMPSILERIGKMLLEIAWWRYKEIFANNKMKCLYSILNFCSKLVGNFAIKVAASVSTSIRDTANNYLMSDLLTERTSSALVGCSGMILTLAKTP